MTGRTKRQRAPSVNKLRAADEQIAALSKQLQAVRLQQESLQLRNRLLERDLRSKAEKHSHNVISQMVDDNTRRIVEGEIIGDGSFSLHTLGKTFELSRQQMVSMTVSEFRRLYGEYVRALAEVLLDCCPEDKSSPIAKRLEALVAESFQILCGFVSTRITPDDIHRFFEGPTGSSAAALLQTIGLTPRQKCALLMLRRVFACNLGAVIAERRQVSAALQAGEVGLEGNQHHLFHTDAVQLVDRLQQLLKQEHGHVVLVNLAFWQRVLTPFQRASLIIQIYPSIHHDAFDMIEEVAKHVGEPDFSLLLEKATSLQDAQCIPMDAALLALPEFLANDKVGCSNCPTELLKGLTRSLGFQDSFLNHDQQLWKT